MSAPKPGDVVRHYKGGVYSVLALGADADDPDVDVVVYRSADDGAVWVRRLSDWQRPTDGGLERFVRITREAFP